MTVSLTSCSASAASPAREESISGCKPPQSSKKGMTSPIQSTSSSEPWKLTEPRSSFVTSAKARIPANTATSGSRSRKPNSLFSTQPIQTIAPFIGAMTCWSKTLANNSNHWRSNRSTSQPKHLTQRQTLPIPHRHSPRPPGHQSAWRPHYFPDTIDQGIPASSHRHLAPLKFLQPLQRSYPV